MTWEWNDDLETPGRTPAPGEERDGGDVPRDAPIPPYTSWRHLAALYDAKMRTTEADQAENAAGTRMRWWTVLTFVTALILCVLSVALVAWGYAPAGFATLAGAAFGGLVVAFVDRPNR